MNMTKTVTITTAMITSMIYKLAEDGSGGETFGAVEDAGIAWVDSAIGYWRVNYASLTS